MSQYIVNGYRDPQIEIVWNIQSRSWEEVANIQTLPGGNPNRAVTSGYTAQQQLYASTAGFTASKWASQDELMQAVMENAQRLVDERNNEAIDKLNFRILKVRRKLSEAITD